MVPTRSWLVYPVTTTRQNMFTASSVPVNRWSGSFRRVISLPTPEVLLLPEVLLRGVGGPLSIRALRYSAEIPLGLQSSVIDFLCQHAPGSSYIPERMGVLRK